MSNSSPKSGLNKIDWLPADKLEKALALISNKDVLHGINVVFETIRLIEVIQGTPDLYAIFNIKDSPAFTDLLATLQIEKVPEPKPCPWCRSYICGCGLTGEEYQAKVDALHKRVFSTKPQKTVPPGDDFHA